jgi:hypothetical protein
MAAGPWDWGRAFITGPSGVGWTDLNQMVDLPDGVVPVRAIDIKNKGQVLAIGLVPEPEPYALMLAGLALIGLMMRHKEAKNQSSSSKSLILPPPLARMEGRIIKAL